jgi:ribose transport system substrate-binding protein
MDSSRRAFLISLAALAASVSISGCGPKKEEGGTTGPAPTGGASNAGGSGGKVVGVSLTSRNHNFFLGMEQGVVDELKAQGLQADIQIAEDQASTQQQQIDQFISKGVAAIIMVPADAQLAVTPVEAANKAKIPIFCIDRRITDPAATVTATIETDNKAMGAEAARYGLKLLCERNKLDPTKPDDVKKLKATVVHNWGIEAASSAQDRAAGFDQVFNATATPGVKIIKVVGDFNAKKSQEVLAPTLAANPDIALIFNHNDDNAVGALNAIIDQKKAREAVSDPKRILIVGMDGNKQAIEAIRKGDIEGTVSQQPIQMGQETVRQVKKVLDGGQPDNQYIPIPFELITQKEANEKQGQLWADLLRTTS